MNKIKGKALSLVLSLALVISSFSAVPASAATKTLNGDLSLDDKNDSLYLVNGGKSLVYTNFGSHVGEPTMETPNHKDVSGVHITAISHKSGDRLVKWYDAGSNHDKTDSIDSDTKDENVDLALRSSTVHGEEKLSILYKGTYTDEDDKEYTVRDTQDVTIRVYDKNETVIGEYGKDGDTDTKGELDSSFAQKTASYEVQKDEKTPNASLTDSKEITVLKAVPAGATGNDALTVEWKALPIAGTGALYTLKTNNDDIKLGDGVQNESSTKADAENDAPGVAVTATGYTISNALSDGTLTYAYTTDGTAPVLKANVAAADNGATKLVTDSKIDLSTLAVAKYKLTVVGFKNMATKTGEFDWQAVTSTVTGTATVAGTEAAKTYVFAADADKAAVAAPALVQGTDTNTNTITITPATVTYYAKVGDADWATVTPSATEVSKVTLAGDTTTVKAFVSTEDTTVLKTPELIAEAADKATVAEGSFTKAITKDDTAKSNTFVTARVVGKAGVGKATFTAEPTAAGKTAAKKPATDADAIKSSSEIKAKTSIDKKIIVDNAFATLSKYSTSTYLSDTTVDKDHKDGDVAVKVTGYEVSFKNPTAVTVDKKATVAKLSGKISSVTVDGGSTVQALNPDDGTATKVIVSDGKISSIDYGDARGSLDVNSTDSSVGDVKDAADVIISNGTVGNIKSNGLVTVKAEDEDHTVSVGDIEAKEISVDSDNSKVSVGTLKATSADSVVTLTGSFVTVKAVDFDNYAAQLKLDSFVGSIPAPKNATEDGATVSTNATDDKVAIKGDADINTIEIGDDSTMTFDGKLNVGSVDGSGTLVVGLGKMNVTSGASGVSLKFSDPTLAKGATAFTAVSDTVDEDSMEGFGFTLSKTEGSKTDTFKIASTKLVGLTFATTSSEIAKGYTENFKASAYAPGTAIPADYKVQYTIEGNDDVFELTNNNDGSVTVKVVDYDKDFSEENKATLKAELVDKDGDVDDEYVAGEVDLTAVATPKVAYTSDTAVKAMKVGDSYRFRITSAAGTQPKSFVVASNGASVTYRGNSGKDYFYDVKAAQVGSFGVYVDGSKLAVLNITNAYSIDTKAVSVNAGKSYQFKVTGPTVPTFTVAGIGNIKAASTSGKDYFFKVTVPANLAKGGHGVYVNGVVMSVLTVK